jgi:hypothetical protein
MGPQQWICYRYEYNTKISYSYHILTSTTKAGKIPQVNYRATTRDHISKQVTLKRFERIYFQENRPGIELTMSVTIK